MKLKTTKLWVNVADSFYIRLHIDDVARLIAAGANIHAASAQEINDFLDLIHYLPIGCDEDFIMECAEGCI